MTAKLRRRSSIDRTPRSGAKRKNSRKGSAGPSRLGSFFLPLFLSVCLLVCLSVLGYLGLQSVTASKFFDVRSVYVSGVGRASSEDIERIAANAAEKSGVWNADLDGIKAKVEKLPFVKSASISRVLPDGLSVHVVEHIPIAIVKLSGGNMLVDGESNILAKANEQEPALPIAITGWDEAKTEKAAKENLERVKLYQKMLDEWRGVGLVSRVRSVDLADLRDPKAITEDAGNVITISVGRDSFAQHLKNGVAAIAGKSDMFDGVSLVGSNMILSSRKKAEEVPH
ncbi:MAG: cell division protein FtsQ/DivIB [Pyrinomonadaceae bacterium]